MKILQHDTHYDVLIAGAGPAGIAAATASARAGAKTLLVEEDPVVGGCITDYFVAMICGHPIQGVLKEIDDICRARYSLQHGSNWYLPHSWLRGIWEVLSPEKNLKVMCGTRILGVNREGRKIKSVIVNHDIFLEEISATTFVDATGSGIFSEMAGCEVMYGRESRQDFDEPHARDLADAVVQDVTWLYISQKLPGYKPFDMTQLEYAKLGVLPQDHYWFHHDKERALRENDGVYLHWGCRTSCRDTRDPAAIAEAQRTALQLMERDHALLRENGYTVIMAPKIGVRECRRIKGHHVMKEQEVGNNLVPEDTIAISKYGLDIWGESVKHDYKIVGYGIPYRSIIPIGVDNLLLAGKLISGSHIAMSSYRCIPGASNIGQAAGVAAALCSQKKTSPENLDAKDVQQTLTSPAQNQILHL